MPTPQPASSLTSALTSDWLGLIALGISVLALIVSWIAYRQRVRYHPQPKLVGRWEAHGFEGQPRSLYVVTNHGDAPARDLAVLAPTSARGREKPWDQRAALDPGESWSLIVPLATGMDWGYGSMGNVYTVTADSKPEESPRLILTWRQAPFAGRKRHKLLRPGPPPNRV